MPANAIEFGSFAWNLKFDHSQVLDRESRSLVEERSPRNLKVAGSNPTWDGWWKTGVGSDTVLRNRFLFLSPNSEIAK